MFFIQLFYVPRAAVILPSVGYRFSFFAEGRDLIHLVANQIAPAAVTENVTQKRRNVQIEIFVHDSGVFIF